VHIGGATAGGLLGLTTGVKLGAGVWLEVRKLEE
jgi:hypothetical protein